MATEQPKKEKTVGLTTFIVVVVVLAVIIGAVFFVMNYQYNQLQGQYNSILNESTACMNITNMELTQTLAPWPTIAFSNGDVLPYGQVFNYSIPYAGYLVITFSSDKQIQWVFAYNPITENYFDIEHPADLLYPGWKMTNATQYYMNGTFNMPVAPGTLYILVYNYEAGTATVTYSITYHY